MIITTSKQSKEIMNTKVIAQQTNSLTIGAENEILPIGIVLDKNHKTMGKKQENNASKLKKIIANKILNMPDDIFLKDMRFNKYFVNKNLHKNLKEDQKYLKWALCRIYLDISFEEAEELAKAEKKYAKKKAVK